MPRKVMTEYAIEYDINNIQGDVRISLPAALWIRNDLLAAADIASDLWYFAFYSK